MPYTFRPHDRRVTASLIAMGRAVQRARASQGISQEVLEARSHIDQSTISRFERGLAPGLRLDRVAQILTGLGVNRLDIVFRTDRPQPDWLNDPLVIRFDDPPTTSAEPSAADALTR
jgi:transcriptional regulator with XRE-family HTH domain